MLLTIVLVVISVILITLGVGFFIWWRKFGKHFFEMSKNITKMNQNIFKNPNGGSFSTDFEQQIRTIHKFFKKR